MIFICTEAHYATSLYFIVETFSRISFDMNTKYKISADHDLTLKIWKNNIPFYHLGTIVCTYDGDGDF